MAPQGPTLRGGPNLLLLPVGLDVKDLGMRNGILTLSRCLDLPACGIGMGVVGV
jgi:hypothetical protein